MHACDACRLRRAPLFTPFSADDLAFMRRFRDGEALLPAGRVLFHEGDRLDTFYTILSGQGARHKSLPNGGRQLVNFVFPGDMVGLAGSVTGAATASLTAASDMVLCRFRRGRLAELFATQPERAFALTWIAAVEEHFLGETIATLGQRNAAQRLAWALSKVYNRLAELGLEDAATGVPFPYRQADLADALGLSLVHTNKTLGRMRSFVQLSAGRLRVLNPPGLTALAMIEDPAPQRRPLL